MKRLLALTLLCGLFSAPAFAAEAAILGTIPPYPGAARPLKHWETNTSAIALTTDKPPAVIAYYLHSMTRAGWKPADGIAAEATAAAEAGSPAWLTFERSGLGRLDVQVTSGKHPKTGQPVTLIFYQSDYKL